MLPPIQQPGKKSLNREARKRELMKIRDTEYANFLEEEKLNISKM